MVLALRGIGEYERALKIQEDIIDFVKEIPNFEYSDIATLYNNLALIYGDLGKYKEALDIKLNVLKLMQRSLGYNDQDLATFYSNLALSYLDVGEFEKALVIQKKAFDIFEVLPSANPRSISAMHSALGSIYKSLGNYQDALHEYQQSLSILKKFQHSDHYQISEVHNNMSIIYQNMGRNDEALRLQKQVNQFLIENLEGNHPSIAASHNNIASIFQSLDRYEEALTQQQKAISILKQTLESDHPDLIKCYGNLATIFQSLGRYEEAIEVQEYVVTLMNSTLGFNSFLVATSYNNLASMYKDLEQFQEAIKAQRKSMFYQLKSNPEHPSMGICYHNMGEYFFNLNHIDSAMFYGYKAYSILKKTLPNSHHLLKAAEKYLSIYNIQSGQDRLTNRDCEGARKHFYEALTYSDSIQAAVVYYLIGDSYYFDKEFELSIKNYNLSYSIEKYDRSIYLNSLCLSYLRMNNFPIAEELLKEYELVSSADGFVYRNWAIYHALQNQPQLALTNLEKALKLGFNDLQKIEEEEAFEVLRDEPRYQAIVEQLRNRN